MKKLDRIYASLLFVIIALTFLLSYTVYLISLSSGGNGVSIILFGGGDDGLFYWNQIQNILNGLPWIKTSIYPQVIAGLISFFNANNPMFVRVINCIVYLVLIYFVIILLEKLNSYKNIFDMEKSKYFMKYFVLIMITVYPSLQMQTHLSIYRDVWLYALYVFLVYISTKVLFDKKYNRLNILLLIIFGYFLGLYRGYMLFSFIISLLIFLVLRKFDITVLNLIILLAVAFSVYYTFFIDYEVPILDYSLRDGLEYRNDAILYGLTGGSQMNVILSQSNILLFYLNYFVSFIGNVFGPLPWQITGISTLIVFFIETIPMIAITAFILINNKVLTSMHKYLLLHSGVWLLLISLSNDNIGTGTRLRATAWILILIVFVDLYFRKRASLSKQEIGVQ